MPWFCYNYVCPRLVVNLGAIGVFSFFLHLYNIEIENSFFLLDGNYLIK